MCYGSFKERMILSSLTSSSACSRNPALMCNFTTWLAVTVSSQSTVRLSYLYKAVNMMMFTNSQCGWDLDADSEHVRDNPPVSSISVRFWFSLQWRLDGTQSPVKLSEVRKSSQPEPLCSAVDQRPCQAVRLYNVIIQTICCPFVSPELSL